jgi:D-aminopeptidase
MPEDIADLLAQRPDEPGLAVAVLRGGEVAARHCAGLASLEHAVPISPATRFHVVSVSKTFTAAAVLLLAARGALALDDDVRRHLPELPEDVCRPAPVTIRHLLSMTSGLRDVLEIERLRGVWRPSPSRARDLLALACGQRAVSAPAGAQYMYANVNFVLLEELIARASGMPAEAFRRAALYAPLGLAATGARPHDGIVLPDLAQSYVPDGAGGWALATDLLGISGDTLTTTLDDLTRWLLALRRGAIEGVDVTAAMAAPARLRDGSAVYYGLGLAVRRYRGLTVLCHTGSQPGYKAHLAYVPARDVGVVILSNREDTRPAPLAAAILERLVGADFPAPDPAATAARSRRAAPGADQTTAIEGGYVEPETGEWIFLALEDGVLRAETLGDPLYLYPASGGVFRDGDDYRATVPAELSVRVGAGPEDVVCGLNLGGQRMTLRKTSPPRYAPERLEAFAGTYESAEIASRHRVDLRGEDLFVEYGLGADGGLTFGMEAIAPDIFLVRPRAPGVAHRHVFRFERSAEGHVVGAVVTMERLKGVPLRRVVAAAPV